MKKIATLFFGLFALLLVTGCQSSKQGEQSLADQLPLDTEKPTLILFYSDN